MATIDARFDRHGRGLGSERHERALPVPYRAAQRRV